MRVRLKGLASATKRLADGSKVTYWYAWRGGPRLEGAPGSPEFMASYNRAVATRCAAPAGRFMSAIAAYKASADFLGLADSTRKIYSVHIKAIEAEFGDAPLKAMSDPRMRVDIIEWRDRAADWPRTADYRVAVLSAILSFAVGRQMVTANHAAGIKRIYQADRAEMIWRDDDLAKLELVASPQVQDVVALALWTAQRQGDLLRLPWTAYDGNSITLRQSKGRRRGRRAPPPIVIPAAKPLRDVLDRLKAENDARKTPSITILVTGRGRPWTTSGFQTSWKKTVERAGLAARDLHFHDLRGSAITRLAVAGCTVPEIATISGHEIGHVQTILDRYLARDPRLAESAIMKLEALEANRSATETANRQQTAPVCSSLS